MSKNPWQDLSSKVVYQNEWGRRIREHQVISPSGDQTVYAVFEVNPGAYIIALTEDSEIYLIKQYRIPISKYSWELPAGGIEEGEEPLAAAKRELQEETGLLAKKWTYIGEFYPSTGSSNETSTVFLAEDLTQTEQNTKEEEGIEETIKIKLPELLKMITSGQIMDGSVMSCLLLAANHLNIEVKQ